jgi:hypothetical protein
VTVAAVETEFTDVEFMAIGNRLDRTVPDIRIPRRKVVPDTSDCDGRHEDSSGGEDER